MKGDGGTPLQTFLYTFVLSGGFGWAVCVQVLAGRFVRKVARLEMLESLRPLYAKEIPLHWRGM